MEGAPLEVSMTHTHLHTELHRLLDSLTTLPFIFVINDNLTSCQTLVSNPNSVLFHYPCVTIQGSPLIQLGKVAGWKD